MTVVSTTVRIPEKLREEARELIALGCFKNLSELMVTALRDEIKEQKTSSSVIYVRKNREELWKEYLKKAKGNPEKATKIFLQEGKKEFAKNPSFWK